jgi:hypothetical protein
MAIAYKFITHSTQPNHFGYLTVSSHFKFTIHFETNLKKHCTDG